ncbi:hypothetical protein [Cupriavidus campinensis]|uniref:Uncharacterized protein n=1 Tax=Cupriavidus campinensis TaxID=151783 RepID=A0ABY3EKJ5_9BURK|nr:hypothetical protein [Cupriavidus campinensis]TSP11440.1 hypothetical protein FGG12_17535 [Cupriavidus campinensis]
MAKRILGYGTNSALVWHDEQDGKCAIETVTDVGPAIERARYLRNCGHSRTGLGDRHMASIPLNVLGPWAEARRMKWIDVINDTGLFNQFMREHSKFIIDEASFSMPASGSVYRGAR